MSQQSDSRKLDGGLPGIWGSLTSDLPREDAGGSSSGTSWYRAGLLRALEARPLPASIAPDAVRTTLIRTTTGKPQPSGVR